MAGRRSYLIFRRDGFVLHTKPVTEERARWLLEEAYYKVPSLELKKKYLNQWGNVLDLTGEKWIEWWGLDQVLSGVYASKEELLARAREAAKDDKAMAESRTFWQRLEELERALDEFLQRPVEPRRLERRPRQPPPALRYVVMRGFRHVRWSRLQHVEYLVPKPEWHVKVVDEDGNDYGISVFGNTFWAWRQEAGSGNVEAVIVSRLAAPEEVAAALLANDEALEFVRKYARTFAGLLGAGRKAMKEDFKDVADAAEAILATALLSPGRRGEEEEGAPA